MHRAASPKAKPDFVTCGPLAEREYGGMTQCFVRFLGRRLLWLAVLLVGLPVHAMAQPVLIFAAASLKTALDAALQDAPVPVRVSYAASSVLARQIAAGAPADLYLSANTAWADQVARQVDLQAQRQLLSNALVVVGPRDSGPIELTAAAILARLGPRGRLAVALTDAVPLGLYARESLQTLGLWAQLRPRLAETDNARSALALVARGEAPLGIVYRTDALAEPRVRVLADLPPHSHAPVRYPLLLISPTPQARAVFEHLQTPEVSRRFRSAGFGVLDE